MRGSGEYVWGSWRPWPQPCALCGSAGAAFAGEARRRLSGRHWATSLVHATPRGEIPGGRYEFLRREIRCYDEEIVRTGLALSPGDRFRSRGLKSGRAGEMRDGIWLWLCGQRKHIIRALVTKLQCVNQEGRRRTRRNAREWVPSNRRTRTALRESIAALQSRFRSVVLCRHRFVACGRKPRAAAREMTVELGGGR